LPRFWEYLGKHVSSIIMYGEETCVREILGFINNVPAPEIIAIVDDDCSCGSISGIPVKRTDWKFSGDIGAVIVASFTDEKNLARKALAWMGSETVPVIKIYNDFFFLQSIDTTFPQWPPSVDILKTQSCIPEKSYIICATERTGSTVFCDLLSQTGLAGRPDEHFNDLLHFMVDNGNIDYYGFIRALIVNTMTPNRIFGTKMHRFMYRRFEKTMKKVVGDEKLKSKALIRSILPEPKYIYLIRRDRVRQGISLWKGHKTDLWHVSDNNNLGEKKEPEYDFFEISKDIRIIERQHSSWCKFFRKNRIRPLVVEYEDMINDFNGTCVKVLDYIGVSLPDNFVIPTPFSKKMANAFTEKCYQRFVDDKRKEALITPSWKRIFGRILKSKNSTTPF